MFSRFSMKTTSVLYLMLTLLGVLHLAATNEKELSKPENGAPKTPRPRMEVCFVLDTTGSMSGLIEGAKQKIWSIANTIIAVKDKPRIKIALVPYRDRGDE